MKGVDGSGVAAGPHRPRNRPLQYDTIPRYRDETRVNVRDIEIAANFNAYRSAYFFIAQ